jgi:hypothetical protein
MPVFFVENLSKFFGARHGKVFSTGKMPRVSNALHTKALLFAAGGFSLALS